MIPVQLQPEPTNFDSDVRMKGRVWLSKKGLSPTSPPPKGTKFPPYWSTTNRQLWDAYSRTCSYLSIYFEFATGASSTDHFIAKSANAGLAYEWSNYRLSCLGPNRIKNNFADVLDPIGLLPETFHWSPANGAIAPNPTLPPEQKRLARLTIKRLRLDSLENREMRLGLFDEYISGNISNQHLKRSCPFVWYEANRQGLL